MNTCQMCRHENSIEATACSICGRKLTAVREGPLETLSVKFDRLAEEIGGQARDSLGKYTIDVPYKNWVVSLVQGFASTEPPSPGYARIVLLYHLAGCQLEAGQLDKAVASLLQLRAVYHSWWGFRAVYYPKSFYLLGKIYEGQGERKLAIENYEKFLKLWKDADEDLPELLDARARYMRLKGFLGS